MADEHLLAAIQASLVAVRLWLSHIALGVLPLLAMSRSARKYSVRTITLWPLFAHLLFLSARFIDDCGL